MIIAQKILVYIFVFCILYVLKSGLDFAAAFKNDKKFDEDNKNKWLFLGLSLSYIITLLTTGFNLF